MKSLIVGLACLAASSPVLAGINTVEASRVGYGLTRAVTVKGTQLAGVHTFPVGQFIYDFRNGVGEGALLLGNKITFCTDLEQDVLPGYALYNVLPVSSAPQPGAPMGAARAQALADIWAAAGGLQFTDADYAAAVQMLIWDIVYDFTGTQASVSVDTGAVRYVVSQQSTSYFSGLVTIFNTLRGAIGTNAPLTNLRAVTNGDNQDQIVIVPSPGATVLLAAGGFVILSRRKR